MVDIIKKKALSIADTLCFYGIIPLLIVGILLLATKDLLVYFIIAWLEIDSRSFLYDLIPYLAYFSMAALWSTWAFTTIREKHYLRLTGRRYGSDHGKYHLTYMELVNYFSQNKKKMLDVEKLPRKKWSESGGIVMGKKGARLISFEPGKNGIIVMAWGEPGVGKTACIVIPTALRFGMKQINGTWRQKGSVMVLDLKGDIYNACKKYRKIKRFSVTHPKDSYHYDPLVTIRRLKNDDDRALLLDSMSVTLIPDDGSKDGLYFTKVARSWYTAVFLFCLHQDSSMTFPDICKEIALHGYTEFGAMIEQSGYETAMKYSMRFKDENPKNVAGGWSKLVESLQIYTGKVLRDLLTDNGKCISPKDLEQCTDVYIQVRATELTLYAPMVAMIYDAFMGHALSHRKEGQNPPICYVLDEFGQLPRMPIIEQSAALMRAYNASILISTQSLAMIDQKYTENGRKSLMDCVRGHCFLSIGDPDTRKWASSLIGQQRVLKASNSLSRSKTPSEGRSASEDKEFIIDPDDFGRLKDTDEQVIYLDGKSVRAEKCYYFK